MWVVLHYFALSLPRPSPADSVARVQSWAHLATDKSVVPLEYCCGAEFRYDGDLASVRGHKLYMASSERWLSDARNLLPGFTTTVLRCDSLEPGVVSLRWRAEWQPPSLVGIEAVAAVLGAHERQRRRPIPVLAQKSETVAISSQLDSPWWGPWCSSKINQDQQHNYYYKI